MINNEFSRKEIVESPADKKSSSKPQESSSYLDRARKGIGVASAGALKALTMGLALQSGFGAVPGVEGIRAPGTGLQAHGDYNRSRVPEQLVKQDHLNQREKQAQIFSAVLDRASKDPRFVRKVLEKVKDHRKLDVVGPTPVCLQDGYPPTSVVGKLIIDPDGSSLVQLDYSFSAVNNCPEPINSIQFEASEIYACPAGCTETSGVKEVKANGIPSSIGQNIMSKEIAFDQLYCKQIDSNGVMTPKAPTGLTVTTHSEGTKVDGFAQSIPSVFKVI